MEVEEGLEGDTPLEMKKYKIRRVVSKRKVMVFERMKRIRMNVISRKEGRLKMCLKVT
jgi:hypothetical protein